MAKSVPSARMSLNLLAGSQKELTATQRYCDTRKTVALTSADWPIARLVDATWQQYFPDVPRANIIVAGYDFRWKTRLGRIRMLVDGSESEITLNTYLDNLQVPSEISVVIIAHEIVHYAQGFSSPLPRMQRHAHNHGAVSHELARRGLGEQERFMYEWARSEWPNLYAIEHTRYREQHGKKTQRRPVAKTAIACTLPLQMVY